jgi:hypothetical protein
MGAITILILAVLCVLLTALTIWAMAQAIGWREECEEGATSLAVARQNVEQLAAENEFLRRDKQVLTERQPRAQDTRRRYSGAELRRLNEQLNVGAPEPTQAEMLRDPSKEN